MHRIEPTQTTSTFEQAPPRPAPGPAPAARASSGPRPSRAALNLSGLCPVCGGEAVRGITASASESRETYRCRVDGETVYGVGPQGRRIQWPTPHELGVEILPVRPAFEVPADPGARFMPLGAAV